MSLSLVSETSFPPVTASSLHTEALKYADREVAQMLKAADDLQDAINIVLNTRLAKQGVLAEAMRFRRQLIAWANNTQSLTERRG
jgi:flagellin-like hook-associated protein FlgL